MPRKNARIDAFVLDALDALGFDGPRSNPRPRAPRAPRPRAPYHPKADPWAVQRAAIAEHLMHAAAARQQARYDADALEVAEYHEAEAARLEDELEASRRPHGPTRQNPVADRAVFIQQDAGDDEEHDFFGQAHALFKEAGIYLHSNYDMFFVIVDDADDQRVVATAAMCLYYTDEPPSIEFSVAVAPDQQRKGLAKKLVEEVIRYTQQSSTEFDWGDDAEVEAYVVNEEAMIPLLTRLGFEQSEADPKRWRRRAFARANPRAAVDDWVTIEDSAYAHGAPDDEVDDWVTIEECGCHACAPARMNPRVAKRRPEGAYGDIESIAAVIENALAQHGLTMANVEVKFTRGGKSRAGACSYSRSRNQCKIMFNGLAWPSFTEGQRLNTVLHEAAHAIQFLTTGRSDHGPVWQRIAKSIGCTGDRCVSVDASQRMADAYAEAKGLPKSKVLTKESAMEASGDFAVGDYVSFEHKRERWYGKIMSKDATHARVRVTQPDMGVGITGKIPYPLLQKEAPPLHAEKVAGVDKPAPGESLAAWLERTGRR